MSKKLTVKDLLKEVQSIKKQAGKPSWVNTLWGYVTYRSSGSPEGKEIADYITDQSKYVAKYFKQVLTQNGLEIKLYDHPLDDGNNSDPRKVWGGQADSDGINAWGFFSMENNKPYVAFQSYIGGRMFHFYEEGPEYKDGDPIKQIRQVKAWLLGAIAELDEELSNL